MKHPIIITSGGRIQRRDKYSIISKYLSSSIGRQTLASSMIAPIRTGLDYQGIARKAFAVQQMPQGALPVYDSDLVADIVTGRYKYDIIRISSGGIVHRKGRLLKPFLRITFPQFELYSNPTIKLSDVKRRRFNIIDRKVQKARQEIMAQEDSMIFDILDKAGK
jgi:hypothetical protein